MILAVVLALGVHLRVQSFTATLDIATCYGLCRLLSVGELPLHGLEMLSEGFFM